MKVKYTDGPITLEEAKMIFHEYYNRRSKTPEGRIRGKMFDIMFHRPEEFRLQPDTPNSIKYALPRGVSRFDMEGVDWFPVGSEVCIEDPDFNKDKNNEVGVKVKGERKTKEGISFRKHFANIYAKRRDGDLKNRNLVDIKNYKQSNKIITKKHKRILVPPKKIDGFDYEIRQFRQFKCDKNNALTCLKDNLPDFNKIAYKVKLGGLIYYIDTGLTVYRHDFSRVGRIPNIPKKLYEEIKDKYLDDDNINDELKSKQHKVLQEWFDEEGLRNINKLV